MQRLIVSADRMRLTLADGSPFVWRGTLDWSLYSRYLHEGEAVARSLAIDRRSVGANTICCAHLLSWAHPLPLTPATPNLFEKLPAFADLLASEGLRLNLNVFNDTASLMPDQGSQLAHWERVYVTLADKDNVTLLLGNAQHHSSQAIDFSVFPKPPSVAGFPALLAAIENPLEDNPPPSPPWDFSCFAGKRSVPFWFMEAGCVSMWTIVHDNVHGASLMYEPPPCGRPGEVYSDTALDAGNWRQFARSHCFTGTIGGNFYADQLAESVPLTGQVRNCAVEYLGNLPQP